MTIYTVASLAAALQVHRTTVEQWIRRGDLDAVRLGDGKRARIRITQAQLDDFLEARSGRYRSARGRTTWRVS